MIEEFNFGYTIQTKIDAKIKNDLNELKVKH